MYHIIINPASRSGKGLQLWNKVIEPALTAEGIEHQSYLSQKEGDVERIAREITGGGPKEDIRLIILGGDGTVNEALQGIQDPSKVLLGYIPTGSSNDLARDLGIPKDPRQALERILRTGKEHVMDMGLMALPDGSKRRFAVSCGIGFDAAVCEEVSYSKAKRVLNRLGLGKLSYLAIALKQLLKAKAISCELVLDGGAPIRFGRILFIAGMVHRFEGGGFRFCPTANDQDGILELCAVGDLSKLLILFALPTAFFGKHYLFHGVEAYRAKKLQISVTEPLCVHTDGEVLGHFQGITVECVPGAIRILC